MGSGASKSHMNFTLSFGDSTVIGNEEEEPEIEQVEVKKDESEEKLLRDEEAAYMSQLSLKEKLRYLELRRLFEEAETTGDAWSRRTHSFKTMPLDPTKIFSSSAEMKSQTEQLEVNSSSERSPTPAVSYEFVKCLNRTCIRTKDGKLIPLPKELHHPPQTITKENYANTPPSSKPQRGKQRMSINTNSSPVQDVEHLSYVPTGNLSFRKSHPLSPCIYSLFENNNVKLVKKNRLRKKLDAHKQPLVIKLIPPLNCLHEGKFEEFLVQVSLTDSQYLRMNFVTICECEHTTSNNDSSMEQGIKKYTGKVFLHSLRPFSKAEKTQLEIGDEILQIDDDIDVNSIVNQTSHDIGSNEYMTISYGSTALMKQPLEEWQKAFDTNLNDVIQKKLSKANTLNSHDVKVCIKVRRYESIYGAIEKNVVSTSSRHNDGMMIEKSRTSAVVRISDTITRVENILPF